MKKTKSLHTNRELIVSSILVALFGLISFNALLASTQKPATPDVLLNSQQSPTPSHTLLESPSATLTLIPANTSSPTIITDTAPLIDCIGPDGKHLKLTQKDCDNFNHAWNPTEAPTATPNSQSTFKPPTFPAAKPPPAFPSPGNSNNSLYEEIMSKVTPSWQPLPNQ